MCELAHGDGRHAVRRGSFDREVDRLDADDLAEPEAAVEPDGRAAVVDRGDRTVGPQVPAGHAVVVQRHEVHAVRVHAAEVGLDEVVGDDRGPIGGRAERRQHPLGLRAQRGLGDEHRVRVATALVLAALGGPEVEVEQPDRVAARRWCAPSARRGGENSSFATWCVLGQVPSWCG